MQQPSCVELSPVRQVQHVVRAAIFSNFAERHGLYLQQGTTHYYSVAQVAGIGVCIPALNSFVPNISTMKVRFPIGVEIICDSGQQTTLCDIQLLTGDTSSDPDCVQFAEIAFTFTVEHFMAAIWCQRRKSGFIDMY
jgi:hypothetical protein